MTSTLLHQSYVTQWHFLLKLISYFAIVFLFVLMFTDNRFPYCSMALPIASLSWLSHIKQ